MPVRTRPKPGDLVVCVGPSSLSADVIKAAQKMAAETGAEWFAVYVETPRMLRLSEAERNRAVYNLRLAEQLGAETVTLRGSDIAPEIIDFARQRQVTRIVAGKPTRHRWSDFLFRNPVDELVGLSSEIDVLITRGAPGESTEAPVLLQPKPFRLPEYEMGLIYITAATILCFLMYPYFD